MVSCLVSTLEDFPGGSDGKASVYNRETPVQSLGGEDTLEKETANHSSTSAWKIPWTEEPGRLQSMGSLRVGHDWASSLHFTSHLVNCFFLLFFFFAAAKSLQSCMTLCDPIDGRPPGPSIPRILQSRTLEWVAIGFCRNCIFICPFFKN